VLAEASLPEVLGAVRAGADVRIGQTPGVPA
jgi:hypothetical protein